MVEKCCEKRRCRGIHVTAGVWYRKHSGQCIKPRNPSPHSSDPGLSHTRSHDGATALTHDDSNGSGGSSSRTGVVSTPRAIPAADCWICHKRIDYHAEPGTTDLSHELDHYYPVSLYPDLQDDPANFRHAHRKCNRERGNGQPKLDLGDVIPAWW